MALGGEMNLYWLWRTHWGGHETMHGAILDTSGRPMHIWDEVLQTKELMAKTGAFLNETKVDAQVAFHFTSRNWNMLSVEPPVVGIDVNHIGHFYKPLSDSGVRVDLIDAYDDLSKYKLLVSPLMMTLEEGDLHSRISEWVRSGGTWVVGPITDLRKYDGTRYQHKAYGILEELTGAEWKYGIAAADKTKKPSVAWTDGTSFDASLWYELFDEIPENTLAAISEGHSALIGKACVLHRAVGKGHVIIVGTIPGPDELQKIYVIACDYAGISHGNVEGELLVIPRSGNGRSGVIVMQYSGTGDGVYRFNGNMKNLVTGEVVSGCITLKSNEIAVLEHMK